MTSVAKNGGKHVRNRAHWDLIKYGNMKITNHKAKKGNPELVLP